MNVNVTFKGFNASDAVKTYVQDRSKKLDKYLPPNTILNAMLSRRRATQDRGNQLRFKSTYFVAKEETENLYSSIDMAFDKLLRQVNKAKTKSVEAKR
jgi:putative sigma-54 modulation protein